MERGLLIKLLSLSLKFQWFGFIVPLSGIFVASKLRRSNYKTLLLLLPDLLILFAVLWVLATTLIWEVQRVPIVD
jgi:hypothetical protein